MAASAFAGVLGELSEEQPFLDPPPNCLKKTSMNPGFLRADGT
jgi:hypothetical protein